MRRCSPARVLRRRERPRRGSGTPVQSPPASPPIAGPCGRAGEVSAAGQRPAGRVSRDGRDVVTSADGRTVDRSRRPSTRGRSPLTSSTTAPAPGDNPDYASQLKTVVIDEDGVEITGFIHADNYFELYVNGQFVARDSIPMTPFNTSVVRFKAQVSDDLRHHGRRLGDAPGRRAWSTPPTTSATRGSSPTSATATARMRTGGPRRSTSRRSTTRAASGSPPTGRDSTFCSQGVRADVRAEGAEHLQGAALPDSVGLDVAALQRFALAGRHHLAARGRDEPGGYTDYTKLFGDAEFIWTRNLRLDNLMLARYTAKGPRKR